jgi:hypothetical protein
VLSVILLLVSVAMSRFAMRVMGRPLAMLEAGSIPVRNGSFEPIRGQPDGR